MISITGRVEDRDLADRLAHPHPPRRLCRLVVRPVRCRQVRTVELGVDVDVRMVRIAKIGTSTCRVRDTDNHNILLRVRMLMHFASVK